MINKHIFFFLEQSTVKEIKSKKYVKIFLTCLGYSVAFLPTISFCCQHAYSFLNFKRVTYDFHSFSWGDMKYFDEQKALS
jgi:hypothetical protein